MNIAIMHCHRAPTVCTGAACFRAFNNRSKSFERYADASVMLCAFFDCGGCEAELGVHAGMTEKMERLKKEGVERIHVGVCVGAKCPKRQALLAYVRGYGFDIIEGTH